MQQESETDNSNSNSNPERFKTKAVLLLSACHFVHDIYSAFLSPLLPLLITKFSLTLARAGLLSTVMQLPSLLNPFIGLWADRISVRWFIILAPSLTAIPMSLIGLAPNYGMLLILLFITGISVSLFHVPSPTLIAVVSGAYTGRGMSFYMTGGELARAVGPLVAVGGVSLLGLEGIYPLMVFGIASSVWLFFTLKDVSPKSKKGLVRPFLWGTWTEMRHILFPLMLLSFVLVDNWFRFVLLVITGFTLLSTTPVMLAIVQENSTNSPSAANGIFMMSSFMARSAITVIVGLLGDLIGLKEHIH